MKIAIYTLFAPIFGRLSNSWKKVFLSHGIDCEVVVLNRQYRGILPAPEGSDLHLYMGGLSMVEFLASQSTWPTGRHVLWLFEALTDKAESVFIKQTQCILEASSRLNMILAMDHLVLEFLTSRTPGTKVAEMPFMIAEEHIRPPRPDSAREVDVLMMGRRSSRRERGEVLFKEHGVNARFVYEGQYGDSRYDLWATSRVNVNIHRDDHFYFDKVRTFEAWAVGTPVVSEQWGHTSVNGIIEGEHIISATLDEMPEACASLLADVQRRQAMVTACQSILRNYYTTEKWTDKMMALLNGL